MPADLWADVRDAARALRHRPGFALLAVLTLAAGMSVNVVAFSVVNALLLKRPAFAHVDRLGWMFVVSRDDPHGSASLPQYESLRADARTLDAVLAEGRLPLGFSQDDRTDQVWSLAVTANYFATLGVEPAAGRLFSEGDRHQLVAVVSHEFWRERLGEAPPGRATVRLNDRECAVVGVLPAGFQGPGGLYAPAVWVPLESRRELGLPRELDEPGREWLTLVGRLRPGVTPAQADAELGAILRPLPGETSPGGAARRGRFAPMADGHPETRALRTAAALGMGVVGIVLLVACFNVAGLLIARAVERRREMALRAALGASAGRLIRRLLVEGLVFSALAGVMALILSMASGRLLAAFSLPAPIPQRIDVAPDSRSAGFVLLMVLVAGLLPSLLPARWALTLDLQPILAGASGTASGTAARARSRRVLQACQIAASTGFLALAVLFAGSFRHVATADRGFDTHGVLVVTADAGLLGREPAAVEAFFRTLAQRLRGDARVREVSVTAGIPYSLTSARGTTLGPGGRDCRTLACEAVELYVVDQGYLKAMGLTLVAGRNLAETDGRPGGGILVSRSAAQRLRPDGSPLGDPVSLGTTGEVAEVVGIVTDVHTGLGARSTPQAYRMIRTADYAGGIVLALGTDGDPAALADTVRRQAANVDRTMPLQSIKTMEEHLRLPLWAPRVAAWFLATCGAVALLLASVGLFGLVSFAVAARGREFGIRMALGANGWSILRLVLREGLMVTAVGVGAGLALGLGSAIALRAALAGITPTAPAAYAVTAVFQSAVALAACAYPAWRSTRTDVLAAVRAEH